MRLFATANSPFVGRVLLLANELAVSVDVVGVDSQGQAPDLVAVNPLRKVPTLVKDDGEVLFDSAVICRWLDREYGASAFHPSDWQFERHLALAVGLCDASYLYINEKRREHPSAHWATRYTMALERGLREFEGAPPQRVDMVFLTLLGLLLHLEFRHPELLTATPGLQRWFEDARRRDSAAGLLAQRASLAGSTQ